MMHKYFTKTVLFALLVTALAATGCKTRNVSMTVMRPADIDVPTHIDTLLLVDRTHFNTQLVDVLESVLTGELPGEDKAGTQEVMASFQQTLAYSNRFYVKNASERLDGNSITAAFPNPLDWGVIEMFCRKYNAQAVVAIEVFDSDFIITDGTRKVKKEITENGVKKQVETDEYYAKGVGNLTIGIRIYDPQNRTIVDQQVFKKTNTWEATGKDVRDAALQLIAKAEATRFLSNQAGNSYAYKIAPMPVNISRQYYKKCKTLPQVATGARQAEVNDWQGALATWKGVTRKHLTEKEGARLCYNIAVAYEVTGDLVAAKEWADRAYVEYGSKKARTYARSLDQRIYEENRVKAQMGQL